MFVLNFPWTTPLNVIYWHIFVQTQILNQTSILHSIIMYIIDKENVILKLVSNIR